MRIPNGKITLARAGVAPMQAAEARKILWRLAVGSQMHRAILGIIELNGQAEAVAEALKVVWVHKYDRMLLSRDRWRWLALIAIAGLVVATWVAGAMILVSP